MTNETAFPTVAAAQKNRKCRAIAWDSGNPGPILGFLAEQDARDYCYCQSQGYWQYDSRPFAAHKQLAVKARV
jgi:hypothetical protein